MLEREHSMKRFKYNFRSSHTRYALPYTVFFIFLTVIMSGFISTHYSYTIREQHEKRGQEKLTYIAKTYRFERTLIRSTIGSGTSFNSAPHFATSGVPPFVLLRIEPPSRHQAKCSAPPALYLGIT